jgi:hypothetical protein
MIFLHPLSIESLRPEDRTTGIALFAVRRRRTAKGRKHTAPPFPKAHGKGRPAHFYPVNNFAVRFGKRQRTAQLVAVRNRRRTAKKRC